MLHKVQSITRFQHIVIVTNSNAIQTAGIWFLIGSSLFKVKMPYPFHICNFHMKFNSCTVGMGTHKSTALIFLSCSNKSLVDVKFRCWFLHSDACHTEFSVLAFCFFGQINIILIYTL